MSKSAKGESSKETKCSKCHEKAQSAVPINKAKETKCSKCHEKAQSAVSVNKVKETKFSNVMRKHKNTRRVKTNEERHDPKGPNE